MAKAKKNNKTLSLLKKVGKNFLATAGAVSLLLGVIISIIQLGDRIFTPKAILKYEITCNSIITPNKILYFDDQKDIYLFQKKQWNKTSNTYKSPTTIDKLQYCELKIINTGNKDIKMSDFYASDRPCIRFGKYTKIIGVYVRNELTPNYINFKIVKMKNKQISFTFDVIEPNDNAVLGILLNDDKETLYGTDFWGRAKDFEKIKPLNYETAEKIGAWEELNALSPLNFWYKISILLLVPMFIYLIYNMTLIYRNIKKGN